MRQRGVAGAEIVERNADAGVAQPLQRAAHAVCVAAQEHGFGHFQFDHRGRHLRVFEQAEQPVGKAFVMQVDARHIERDMADGQRVAPPARAIGDDPIDHAGGERRPQFGMFERDGDVAGHDDSAVRGGAAEQRLETDDAAIFQRHLGLVPGAGLFLRQYVAGAIEHGGFAFPAVEQVGAEQDRASAAIILGVVQRDIGMFEQGRIVRAMVGIESDADAGAAFDRSPGMAERRMEMIGDARQDRLQRGGVGQAREQDGEFVAAHARDEIAGTQRLAQPVGHGAQQRVARVMAGGVVDALEFVEVEQQHGRQAAMIRGGGRLRHGGHEMRAVGKAGQRIAHRQPLQPQFGLLALGDVDDAGHIGCVAIDHDRARRQQRVARHPVGAPQPAFELVDRLALFQPLDQLRARPAVDIAMLDIVQHHLQPGGIAFARGAVHAQQRAVAARDQQGQGHRHEQALQRVAARRQRGLRRHRHAAGMPFLALQPIVARDRDPHAAMQDQHRHHHAGHGGGEGRRRQIADQQRHFAGQAATHIAAKAGRHHQVEDQGQQHENEDGDVAARADQEGDADRRHRLPGEADPLDRAEAGHAAAEIEADERPDHHRHARRHRHPEMVGPGKAPVADQEQAVEQGREGKEDARMMTRFGQPFGLEYGFGGGLAKLAGERSNFRHSSSMG